MKLKRSNILPALLFLSVLSLPILVSYGYSLTKNSHLKRFVSSNLAGITVNTDSKTLNRKNWFNHKYSNSLNTWFSENIPFREYMVRLNNQLYFSLFQKSYMYDQTLIVGKQDQLYEIAYIYGYLGLNPPMREDAKQRLAQNIREVQELFRRRGILFYVLVTPNKAYIYPEYIPDRFKVRPLPTDRNYDSMSKLFAANGTNYVDGLKILQDAKKSSGQELFPALGTHWNTLGAGLATTELMDRIGGSLGKPVYNIKAKVPFAQDPAPNADKDLYSLCNLLDKKDGFASIDPVYETIGSRGALKLKVALVGGSFTTCLMYLMVQYGLVSELDRYYYYTLGFQTFPEDKTRTANFSRIWGPKDFVDKDVVILEINANNFDGSHVSMFLEDCQMYLNPSY